MPPAPSIDSRDQALIQIVDAAMAESARKSGAWLVCRLGCTQCCIGPFPITQLDAHRLRRGLAELEAGDPERASQIRERARESLARIAKDFPGDPVSGVLSEDEAEQAQFADFANEEPCPALDPETGACDLYAARPVSCRTFGPPARCDAGSLGVCELCFQGASDDEIAACEVEVDPDGLEAGLLEDFEKTTGARGETIVAFCLV